MINEFLQNAYQYCGDQHQIIQGYVLCDDYISECKNYTQRFNCPAIFSAENFKIMTSKIENYKLVIIFSQTFLIDPSKCSFLISTNNQTLPFYPKQMSYRLNLIENHKITLFNSQNRYNLREQIFLNTFERLLKTRSLIPILICPKQLLTTIWEYFIQQDCYVGSLEELQEAEMMQQKQVKLGNAIIANTLIDGCELFQKYIQIKPKFSKKEIEFKIMDLTQHKLENSISQFKGMSIMIRENNGFIQQLMKFVKNIISQFFISIEETIDLLLENDFDPKELHQILEGQVENQVNKFAIQMHEFALIEQADFIILFEKIKEIIYFINKDIEQFIIKASKFVDEQMLKVNQIFQDYPALANVNTFQAIQTDASQTIVRELKNDYLREKSNFWRPEFNNYFEFTKKILISYLEYKEEKMINPTINSSLQTTLIRMGMDQKMPIQTIQIIVNRNDRDFVKEKDELFIEKINIITSGKRSAFKLYLHSKEQIVLYMNQHQIVIVSFDYFNQKLWTEVEKYQNLNMKLSQGVQHILETNIEYVKNIRLYEQEGCEYQIDKNGQSKLIVNFSMNMDEQLRKMKKKFCNKIGQAQKGGAPKPIDPSILAAGAIGSGIGILIIDCLDDNISWQKKLQRAGYGTAETTALATLSMNLPFVGFLIGQTFLLYSVHKVFSNKVLSMQNKLKNMGHIGAKVSIGIGSAMAGQILIPLPVVGALIGSVVGGVGLGLYHKFVIPTTRNSLISIFNRLEQFIQINGQLKYEEQVLKKMKINRSHFFENQPINLNNSDWLTLISVHLVNIVEYLLQLQFEERRKKILEIDDFPLKIEQFIDLEQKQDKLLEKLSKWKSCRDYIYKENISTFKYAKQVGIFVTGMISNFKI
ncbi:unnamed protein product [Paramecium sonneborni]|uniref:Transmembrane protein n=1 Tax=Paramecium sonneborni TaxID=65129 RepID=A0A8S1KPF9_9CILI|nr:unnamed protein product [Paramecium sonneborni]